MPAGGEVVSAATLVAAVLEHQGYLTQARFLEVFQSLFRDAGALFLLVAGAGAVFSMLAFGNYRAARYLLIGPGLFWALVVPRAENFNGALWKLGDSQNLGLRAVGGDAAALSTREKLFAKLNQQGQGPNSNVRIAEGFRLFSQPMSDFVNEMVSLILKDEERSDLLVASRVHGLYLIATSMPRDTGFVQRLEEGFLLHCQRTMASAHAAAQVLVKEKGKGAFRAQLGTNNTGQNGDTYQRIAKYHLENMLAFATTKETVPTERTGFAELIRSHAQSGQQSTSHAKKLAHANGEPFVEITCADAWSVLAEEIWHRAALEQERILRVGSGGLRSEGVEAEACVGMMDKAVAEGQAAENQSSATGDLCDLRPAISLAVLNRRFSQNELYNRVLKRHWNDSPHRNPASNFQLSAGSLAQQGFSSVFGPNGRAILKSLTTAQGKAGTAALYAKDQKMADGGIQRTYAWSPVMELNIDYGMDDAMWTTTRIFEIYNLRRQLFTYALNVPYYQGLILYLVAAGYPFFALLVIVPGKASAFLIVPLTWIWAKSWDIGFAAAILVDKVLFNLLPSQNVFEPLRTGPWRDINLLPRALAEAANFDPLGSMHSYYAVLSMIWLNVPTVAGFIFLSARRGLMSSFSDAAAQTAREAGGDAGSGFGVEEQDRGNRAMREIMNFAGGLHTLGSQQQGLRAGAAMPDAVARSWAAMRAAAAGAKDADIQKLLSRDPSALSGMSDVGKAAAKQFFDTYKDVFAAESAISRDFSRVYDSFHGRNAVLSQLMGAKVASGEGATGYELYRHTENIVDPLLAVQTGRLMTTLDIYGDLLKGGINQGVRALDGEFNRAGLRFGVPEFMVSLSALTIGAEQLADTRPQGYSDEQFKQRLYVTFPSLEVAPDFSFTGSNNPSQTVHNAVFGVLSPTPAPGGYGSAEFLGAFAQTMGGQRIVETYSKDNPPPPFGVPQAELKHSFLLPQVSFSSYDPKSLEADLSNDAKLAQGYPQQYRHDVEARREILTGFYGKEALEKFFGERGEAVPASGPTTKQLYDYTSHLQEKEDAGAKENEQSERYRPPRLNSGYKTKTQSHENAALRHLEDWNARRGRRLDIPVLGSSPFRVLNDVPETWGASDVKR